nr:hypothetical protein Q903MT_gene688 [Picea sitchensis]
MIVLQMNLPLPMLLPLRDKLIQDKQLVLPHQSNRPVIFPPSGKKGLSKKKKGR